jgi:hypothetical protein
MMRVHRLLGAGLVTLGVLAGGLVLGGSPALAGTGHGPVTGQFGSEGSGDGQLNSPRGVAVDDDPASPSVGDVYVVDRGNRRVEKFTAAGVYISQFDGSEAPQGPFSDLTGVAVDPSSGDVWVADALRGVVDEFTPEGKYAGVQLTGTPASAKITGEVHLGNPFGVAVNSEGDVYVNDNHYGVVDKFTAAGAYISQFEAVDRIGLGGFGVAVDSEGNVYVAEEDEGVREYSSAGVFEAQLGSEASEALAVAVDPSSGDVYTVERRVGGMIQVFRAGALIYQFGSLDGSFGLAVSLNGTIYATEPGGNDVKIFAAGPTATKPETFAASEVKATSAVLNSELLGGESGYYFSYATGGRCEDAGKTGLFPATGTVAESALVTGLEPSTLYTYCAVAESGYGPAFGSPVTFETAPSPPLVEEIGVSGIGPFEATLKARVNPEKQDTTCAFEYAKNGEPYGSPVACEPADLGDGYGRQSASLHVEGLQGGTTYQYRVVVKDSTLPAVEDTGQFTTAAALKPLIEAQSASVETGTGTEPRGVTLGAQIDPELQETVSCVFEYITEATFKASGFTGTPPSVPCEPSQTFGKGKSTGVSVTAKAGGLEAGVDYHYRLVVADTTGTSEGTGQVFGPPIPVTGEVLSGVPGVAPGTTATVGGEVDPEGVDTRYYVQYGTSSEYGQNAPFAPMSAEEEVEGLHALPAGIDAGSGSAPVVLGAGGGPPTVSLEGLSGGVAYDYRLVAYNADGTAYGAPMTVRVLPAPLVGPATVSEVTQSSATISTSVNPEGLHTLYKLDVGTSTAYGTPYPGDAGSGTVAVPLTFKLSGLQAGDTYHFRLVASNSDGTSSEEDQTFTTVAGAPGFVPVFAVTPSLPPLPFTALAFPTETGTTTTTTTPRTLTMAQKLSKALKACRKDTKKSRRAVCERHARKRYGPPKKKRQ